MPNKIRKIVAPPTVRPSTTSDLLKIIAGDSKNLPTMSSKLAPIRYIPTIFTSFNRAVVIGGAPVRATWLVHGPTASGKTVFALGMVNSFMNQGHIAAYIDAEHAISKTWFQQLGADMDNILFEQPDTFEDAVDQVDKWLTNFRVNKEKGIIPATTAFIIVVDVIHKLVPKKELAKITGKASSDRNPLDAGWGRYRANLISVWIDKLTPFVGKNDVAFVMLAHERESAHTDNWFAPDYKVKGGAGLMFEAMVRVRLNEAVPIYTQSKSSGKKIEVGKKHSFKVAKNKVGYPNESGVFFTSNGKGTAPIGFDLAQEIFVEAENRGIVKSSGSYYIFPDDTKVQGKENAYVYLRDPDNYQSLYDELLLDLDQIEYEDEDDDE